LNRNYIWYVGDWWGGDGWAPGGGERLLLPLQSTGQFYDVTGSERMDFICMHRYIQAGHTPHRVQGCEGARVRGCEGAGVRGCRGAGPGSQTLRVHFSPPPQGPRPLPCWLSVLRPLIEATDPVYEYGLASCVKVVTAPTAISDARATCANPVSAVFPRKSAGRLSFQEMRAGVDLTTTLLWTVAQVIGSGVMGGRSGV
jgi:hypothetical protein